MTITGTTESLTVDRRELLRHVTRVARTVAKGDNEAQRPVLGTVLVEQKGNSLILASADSFQLTYVDMPITRENVTYHPWRLSVGVPELKVALEPEAGNRLEVSVNDDTSVLLFQGPKNNWTGITSFQAHHHTFDTVNRDYPRLDTILGTVKAETLAVFDPRPLLRIIDTFRLPPDFSRAGQEERQLQLFIDKATLTLTPVGVYRDHPDIPEMFTFPVDTRGPAAKVQVQQQFLANALRSATKPVSLQMGKYSDPIRLDSHEGEATITSVIMPVYAAELAPVNERLGPTSRFGVR